MSKARQLADLGNAYSDGALSNRNLIINGAMVHDQRNGGSSITPTAWTYSVDRFRAEIGQASKLTLQQDAGSVTPPDGFSHYLGVTSTSAYTPVTADYFYLNTQIEGYNAAQLAWGSVNAKDATLSFWVRSSVTGTHSGTLANGNWTRSYPYTFTISAANTWEYKTVTVEGDTSGTWATDNTSGIQVTFSLGGGTTYRGTAGAWASVDNRAGVTGSVNIVATNAATFYITGVQLEVGDTSTPFEHRSFADQLQACQRYYRKVGTVNGSDYLLESSITGNTNRIGVPIFDLPFRASPTITHYHFTTGTTGQLREFSSGTTRTVTVSGNMGVYGGGYIQLDAALVNPLIYVATYDAEL